MTKFFLALLIPLVSFAASVNTVTVAGTPVVGDGSSLTIPLVAVSVGTPIASAATIAPTTALLHVTGTAAISTITPPASFAITGYGGCIRIIPDAAFTTATGGNVALASTAVVNKVLEVCYDKTTALWYPSY